MAKFKHTSVEDQMEKFSLTKEEAEEKIRILKEKLKNRPSTKGKPRFNMYDVKQQMEKFSLTKEEAEEKIKELKSRTNPVGKTTMEYWSKKGMCDTAAKLKAESYKKSITTGHLTSDPEWQMQRFNISKKEAETKIKDAFKQRRESYIKLKETDPERFKAIRPTDKAHWLRKGYSLVESEKKAKEYQENMRAVFQKNIRDNPEMYKGRTPLELDYWLNKGYSLDDAKAKRKERQQTFSKEICIHKYGKIKGIRIWKQRQIKWLSNYKRSNFSKISQTLFKSVYEEIKDKYKEIYFATLDKEKNYNDNGRNFEYRLLLNDKIILPDFFIKDIGKIIEFDGTYWHRKNPENKTREAQRDNAIVKAGYKVFHISESDYNENPEKVINECIKFLNTKT